MDCPGDAPAADAAGIADALAPTSMEVREIMNFSQFLSFLGRRGGKARTARPASRASRAGQTLRLEQLEDRLVPSTTISGFVYNDVNNNGIYDAGEKPLANTTVALYDSANQLVGTTTTDLNGFYKFTGDPRVNTDPKTLTQTVHLDDTPTN